MESPLTDKRHEVRGRAPEAEEDLDWVERAQQGDCSAFEMLARRHLDRTFRVAFRSLGNREDAEDVVQETFVRAQQRLHGFGGRAAFGTWITSIAIRLCLDHERRRRRRPVIGIDDAELGRIQAKLPDGPRLHAQERETLRRIDSAVRSLPARLRSAFVLRVLEGLEYRQVGQALGTSLRTARIYVSEARRRLARRVIDRAGGDP